MVRIVVEMANAWVMLRMVMARWISSDGDEIGILMWLKSMLRDSLWIQESDEKLGSSAIYYIIWQEIDAFKYWHVTKLSIMLLFRCCFIVSS